jgi:hypothetical protein
MYFVDSRLMNFCRLSLSNDTYKVIKSPIDFNSCEMDSFVGKSKGGVHFAVVDYNNTLVRLQVWILKESEDRTTAKWLLKHDSDLNTHARHGYRWV